MRDLVTRKTIAYRFDECIAISYFLEGIIGVILWKEVVVSAKAAVVKLPHCVLKISGATSYFLLLTSFFLLLTDRDISIDSIFDIALN